MKMACGQPLAACDSAAMRRRQRRLRSLLRRERTTVAKALAEKLHHSAQRPEMARAGEWGREMNFTATIRDPPLPSRSSSASTKKSPAERGRTGFPPCLGRRSGFCGAPWSRLSRRPGRPPRCRAPRFLSRRCPSGLADGKDDRGIRWRHVWGRSCGTYWWMVGTNLTTQVDSPPAQGGTQILGNFTFLGLTSL